jgi:hypothetical protein
LPILVGNNWVARKPQGERKEAAMTTEWEKLYHAAILETDWLKIEERIKAAGSAISARLNEFSSDHGGTPEENQRIQDALNGLSILRGEVVTWRSKAAD